MSDAEILERIQKVYNRVTGRTDVILTPNTRLLKKDEVSSLTMIELVACIEDEFDIVLRYSEIRSLKNVRGLMKIIRESS
ncbi:MAG: acyl carrier protein [Lachnospiraceae bacterium]|nr:acyl carrier protein [Lachnospiraceae bacterium]